MAGQSSVLIDHPTIAPSMGSASCTGCRFLLGYPGPICHCHLWQSPFTLAKASIHSCSLWSPR